jgi:hypothetical protein
MFRREILPPSSGQKTSTLKVNATNSSQTMETQGYPVSQPRRPQFKSSIVFPQKQMYTSITMFTSMSPQTRSSKWTITANLRIYSLIFFPFFLILHRCRTVNLTANYVMYTYSIRNSRTISNVLYVTWWLSRLVWFLSRINVYLVELLSHSWTQATFMTSDSDHLASEGKNEGTSYFKNTYVFKTSNPCSIGNKNTKRSTFVLS